MLMLASGVSVMPGFGYAAMSGSLTGSDITLPDATMLIADQTLNGGLYGIMVPSTVPGKVVIGTGSTVRVTDAEHYAQGIFIKGPNSLFTADKLIVSVSGITASAFELTGKQSTADLGTGSSLNTAATGIAYAEGLTVSNASSLTAEQLQISTQGINGLALHISGYDTQVSLGNNSAIQTNGNNSDGVRIDAFTGNPTGSSPLLTANHLTINTLGNSSPGINIQSDSEVRLGSNSTIITSGVTSVGIVNMGTVTADHLTISTAGDDSAGLSVRASGLANIGAGSQVASAQSGAIVAMDEGSTLNFFGTEAERSTLKSAGLYGAMAQLAGATVNLRNTDIAINSVNIIGHGLLAISGQITGQNLTINGLAKSTYGVYAVAGGQIHLQGDLKIDMGSPDGVAMATEHFDGFAPGVIDADGRMNITGSVGALGGLIDLNFAPGSLWSGRAVSDNVNGGHLNIQLTDSQWRVAGDSVVDNLQMQHSLVDLSAASDDSRYATLKVANLSGSGDFALRTNLAGDGNGVNNIGDKVVVTESSAGDYRLLIQNRGSAATNGDEVLTVVETPDGVARFTGDSAVELGGYVYTVNKQGTHWVLSSPAAEAEAPEIIPTVPAEKPEPIPVAPAEDAETTPATPPDSAEAAPVITGDNESPSPAAPAVIPPDSSGPSVISSSANAGANFLNIGYLINYAETQTLMQRMGDIRQGKTDGNVWLRGIDGRFSGFATGKLSHFSLNYTGYQFGVDKRLSDEVPVYLGLFMGATTGSPHYQSGNGATRSSHFGLYSNWMNEEGFYIDGVVKFNRLKNQFSVNDTQQNRVAGSGVSSGFSLSLEAGKKFSFSDNANGFYLEPQMQMTAGHQNGSSLRASNGLNIDLSNYKSVLGRASVLAGYEINQRGYQLNGYLKTGMMREFAGDANYALNGSRETLSFKGNSWNNGIGVSAKRNNHTLFIEADSDDGSRFRQRQINAGYRFSF